MRMALVRRLFDLAEEIRQKTQTADHAAGLVRDLADELARELIDVAGRPRTDGSEMDYQRGFERRQLLKIIENLSSSQSRDVDVTAISSVITALRSQATRLQLAECPSPEELGALLVDWAQRLEDALGGKMLWVDKP